ncbi:MAG TPA: SAF domain-containing protein [Candidatus Brocadiia bacterium]|nr:SAF domain-containing protein [Candidatus Brocadiia bacterium]
MNIRRAIIFLVVAVICGIGIIIILLMQKPQAQAAQVKTVGILIAARDIPFGEEMSQENLKVANYPEEFKPETAVESSKWKEAVEGRRVKYPFVAGEIITEAKLYAKSEQMLPPNMRRIKPDPDAVKSAGVQAGDVVNILMMKSGVEEMSIRDVRLLQDPPKKDSKDKPEIYGAVPQKVGEEYERVASGKYQQIVQKVPETAAYRVASISRPKAQVDTDDKKARIEALMEKAENFLKGKEYQKARDAAEEAMKLVEEGSSEWLLVRELMAKIEEATPKTVIIEKTKDPEDEFAVKTRQLINDGKLDEAETALTGPDAQALGGKTTVKDLLKALRLEIVNKAPDRMMKKHIDSINGMIETGDLIGARDVWTQFDEDFNDVDLRKKTVVEKDTADRTITNLDAAIKDKAKKLDTTLKFLQDHQKAKRTEAAMEQLQRLKKEGPMSSQYRQGCELLGVKTDNAEVLKPQ